MWKVIDLFDLFIDLCIVNENEKQQWKTSIGHYHKLMKQLCKKANLTVGKLESFQAKLVNFCYLCLFNWTGRCDQLHLYVGFGAHFRIPHILR